MMKFTNADNQSYVHENTNMSYHPSLFFLENKSIYYGL